MSRSSSFQLLILSGFVFSGCQIHKPPSVAATPTPDKSRDKPSAETTPIRGIAYDSFSGNVVITQLRPLVADPSSSAYAIPCGNAVASPHAQVGLRFVQVQENSIADELLQAPPSKSRKARTRVMDTAELTQVLDSLYSRGLARIPDSKSVRDWETFTSEVTWKYSNPVHDVEAPTAESVEFWIEFHGRPSSKFHRGETLVLEGGKMSGCDNNLLLFSAEEIPELPTRDESPSSSAAK